MNDSLSRILIIGGVAAGTKTAAKARRHDPHSEIIVFSEEEHISYAGCGEPYYISGHIQNRAALLARTPEQFDALYQIKVAIRHRVTKINPDRKTITVENLTDGSTREEPYTKLIISTGAVPVVPKLLGIDLSGVFTLRTIPDTDAIQAYINNGSVKNAVVVGGGFIGLEMIEALTLRGIKVTLVERLPLPAANFDPLIGWHIKNTLENNKVRVLLDSSLEEIRGNVDSRVSSVLVNGESLEADLVLLSVGVKPNVKLAQEAGITIGITGAIRVDDHLQTNISGIYAAGDCVEVKQIVTGKPVWVPLGSTANRQGRVLGLNLTGGDEVFPGILGTGIFRVFDLNVGRTGIGEEEAKKEGFEAASVIVPAGDTPHYMPEGKTVITKMIADKITGRLLGAECWGQGKVDKVIDTLATAITFKAKIQDIQQLDLAYSPPFAPPLGNTAVAANVLQNRLDGFIEGISPLELKARLDAGEDIVLIDVRPPQGRAKVCTQTEINIPVPALRNRLAEIPKDKFVVTVCNIGLNASLAYIILKQNGFDTVKVLDGGVTAWPHPLSGPSA